MRHPQKGERGVHSQSSAAKTLWLQLSPKGKALNPVGKRGIQIAHAGSQGAWEDAGMLSCLPVPLY